VREHLRIYGRLKGLPAHGALEHDVDALMDVTDLAQYADRLASRLSGGNQRKLALAIALIGAYTIASNTCTFTEDTDRESGGRSHR
jgi:ATP-binding cassette subfamily A (ABC1) protein 3